MKRLITAVLLAQLIALSLAAETEKTRTPLAEAIKTAFVPVTHTIRITAE